MWVVIQSTLLCTHRGTFIEVGVTPDVSGKMDTDNYFQIPFLDAAQRATAM